MGSIGRVGHVSKASSKLNKAVSGKLKQELIAKTENAVKITKTVPISANVVKPVPSSGPRFEPNADGIRYWLVKSEPLKRIDKKTGNDVSFPLSEMLKVEKESWDGVRNWELRNHMLQMRVGDVLLFYHSNCPTPGIVGVVKISAELHPDDSQFDETRQYFDAKSTLEKPRWWCVDVSFVRRLRHKISLNELKANAKLQEFLLVKRGRLSVIPVSEEDYLEVMKMEKDGDVRDDIDCEIDRKLIEVGGEIDGN